MRPRILSVDDEEEWLDNFRAWIPPDIADQHSTKSTQEAVDLLRKYRYHLVLLDLSMTTENAIDRSNRSVQDYLANRPEGTVYIVVSGTVRKEEVKNAAYSLNAFDVVFKELIDPLSFKDRVIEAIEQASMQNGNLISQSEKKLVSGLYEENLILRAIDPGGAKGLYNALSNLARQLAPVAQHKDRPHLVAVDNCVFGLVWSRQIGNAVSIVMTNPATSEDESVARLADWFGYPDREFLFKLDLDKVRVQCFKETNVTDSHFDLPTIA